MAEEGGKTDDLKGRAKEAAGALLDDEELRKEGRVDQAAGKVKSRAGEVIDKVKEKLLGKDEKEDASDDGGRER